MLLLLLTLFQLQADPYAGQDFSEIWPGFNAQMPIVLNYLDGPKTFNFDSKLPEGIEKIALAPEYRLGDKKVFVMRYHDSFTFIHELFHRYQKEHFTFKESQGYPDLYNAENQALMQIEEEILLKYAREPREVLKTDYLLVREYRMRQLNQASIDFEDREEKLEGLANFAAMASTNNKKPVLEMLEGLVKDKNIIDKSLKWRFYVTGALMAQMLDKEGKDWKKAVESDSLLSQFTITKDEARLRNLLENYRYQQKKQDMVHEIDRIKEGLIRLRKDYERSSGREVQILFASPPSSGGTVDKILALNENEKVALKESGRTECEEWVLETREIPFIFKTNEALIFKIQNVIIVDGQNINLEDISEPLFFKEIAWTDQQSRFRSKKQGILIPHEKSLEIRFQASD